MKTYPSDYHVAVVGATGAVGQTMIALLEQRQFPVKTLTALASARSVGQQLEFKRTQVDVQDLAQFNPARVDIALFSAGSQIAKEYAPRFVSAGAVVIDNSSAFRLEHDVPLVIPEVNLEMLDRRPRGIVANPNCSTMQMLTALAPLHRAYGIERIIVSTYQSVSGAGRLAMEELGKQTANMLAFQSIQPECFPVQIAFNVIPHIDEFLDNGYTKEEMKLVWETRKILADDSIQVTATAVRVPVFYGHSEAVTIQTRQCIEPGEARALLERAAGVQVVDSLQPGGYPTPITHASGQDGVYVGRIRADLSSANGLNLWIVSDNLRKGAALNAVQLAECIVTKGLDRT